MCIGAVWCAGAAASEFDAIFAQTRDRSAESARRRRMWPRCGEVAMSDVVKL